MIAPIWQKKICKMQKIQIIWKNNFDCLSKFLTVVCNFLQCDYCQIENVSMDFSSPLVTENSFQITRLRLVIWKDFLSLVVRKNPYSHFLLTVISHLYYTYTTECSYNTRKTVSSALIQCVVLYGCLGQIVSITGMSENFSM